MESGIKGHLRWSEPEPQPHWPDDHETLGRWDQLALASAAAAQHVTDRGAGLQDESTMLALLHNAPQWLRASAGSASPADRDSGELAAALPDWLVGRLRQLEHEPDAHGPVSQVADVLRRPKQKPPSEDVPGNEAGEPIAGGRWRVLQGPLAAVFPGLVGRLLRCIYWRRILPPNWNGKKCWP